jgi:integrase
VAPISIIALAAIKSMPTWPGKRWVFENQQNGKPLSKRALSKRFDRMRARFNFAGANGEPVWRHDLRRTHITLGVRSGTDRDTIKQGSGHTTNAAFERYNVTRPDDIIRAREIRDAEMLTTLREMTGRRDAHKAESGFLSVILSVAEAQGAKGK